MRAGTDNAGARRVMPSRAHNGRLQALVERGLVSAPALQSAMRQFASSGGTGSLKELLRHLVKQSLLTPYQAGLISQGKLNDLVLGNYVVLDLIGRGGAGKVLKAWHPGLNRIAALKLLKSADSASAVARQRFQREVVMTACLDHPNIVAVYDADYSRGKLVLVMQYLDGRNLAQLVKEGGRLDIKTAVNYVVQAAHGLQYAHSRGIVHRDMKPSNLFLAQCGTIKALDLGLARFTSPSHYQDELDLTRVGIVMGTVDYISPEQVQNTSRADERADIYSLGATLYYLLTGAPPYRGRTFTETLLAHRDHPVPSLRAARPEICLELDAVFGSMLAKDPAHRPQSMGEVIEALEYVYRSQSASSPSPSQSCEDPNLSTFLRAFNSPAGPSAATPALVAPHLEIVPRTELPCRPGSRRSAATGWRSALGFLTSLLV